MAKHVLILGAGLVSQPLIDYLFANTDFKLTVADILRENASRAIDGNPRGQAADLDVNDTELLGRLVADSDLVVSLLPYSLHSVVAKHCLAAGKSMVNASYVSPEMRAFDQQAREQGLLFLCEMGLDPGIDHMSAMQIIHDVQQRGGTISEFVSVCGGLPAPEANDNPFGYKFSWSPKGVLLAGNSAARYIKGGQVEEISAEQLFHSTRSMRIDDLDFEAYPNRDSVYYEDIYGLHDIQYLMRGTLRYDGWHDLILALKALHLLEDHKLSEKHTSFARILAELNALEVANVKAAVAEKLQIAPDSRIIRALDWLGIFDDTDQKLEAETVIDALASIMSRKMAYGPAERDMVALQHHFKATFPDHKEAIQATLFDFGIPGGNSSMARTVSLPMAIAIKLILQGKIDLSGVRIPVDPSIYEPVLSELATLGIAFKEEITIS